MDISGMLVSRFIGQTFETITLTELLIEIEHIINLKVGEKENDRT